jgi:HlyD family secretion protein
MQLVDFTSDCCWHSLCNRLCVLMSNPMDRPLSPSRWQRPAWIGGSVLAVVTIAALFVATYETGRVLRLEAKNVTVATVERGIFHDFVPLRGRVEPRDVVFLDAQEGGRVERVLVEAGDVVSAGEPLIEFGNTDLQLQVIEREARLIEQINNLRGIEMALEQMHTANQRTLVEIDYNITRLGRLAQRRDALANRGALSPEENEKVLDELAYYRRLKPLSSESATKQEAMRQARLPEIHDGLTKLRENLVVTRGKLDNLIVRAPVAGRVTEMDLKVGQNCERGRRLAQITPDTGFKLTAEIDEFYLRRVRPRQEAQMDFGDTAVTLSVTRVYPQVKEGRFAIDLAFERAEPGGLLPGQALQGKLRLGEDRPAVTLPTGAFLEESGGDWIFVVAKDGREASRRRIQVGRRNSEQLEILGGLEPGERVIVSGYTGFERIDRIELTH